ncbi:MAG: MMPL family transporter [Oscillospiraceae bacterium]|jgi:predicted RND superfamily exporter protein|nr:MMPL family transporter [Oscillospiraceae bacterium]
MRAVSNFIVGKSKIILSVFIALALLSLWLATRVNVNSDMTKYLPEDSPTKAGMSIMKDEFPASSSVNLMFAGLTESDKTRIAAELSEAGHVTGVAYAPDGARYNKDGYALYTVTFDLAGGTPESIAAVGEIEARYSELDLTFSGDAAGNTTIDIVTKISVVAAILGLIILFVIGDSWITPVLLLASLAVAIALNMGTNIFLGEVSEITNQIAAILQLCLSMDYSIMLLDRYDQEKKTMTDAGGAVDKKEAMRNALRHAFAAISSSSVTTIVGMLALVFMSFTIGRDMGFVLAKGVLLSLICIFAVLPALILIFDGLIEKTRKKALHVGTDKLAALSFRVRRAVPVVFIALLAAGFFLKGGVGITYTLSEYDKIGAVFTLDNPVVVLYENSDEALAAPLAEKWAGNASADSVNSYASTLGLPLTSEEAAEAMGLDPALTAQLYTLYSLHDSMLDSSRRPGSNDGYDKLPLYDFMRYVIDEAASDERFKPFITDEMTATLNAAGETLENAKRQFVGETYSRVIVNTSLAEESQETFNFLADIERDLSALPGRHYILGASAVAYEMSRDFPSEMNFITILTVIAIFAVVAVAFRSLSVPLILVCVVQCAVFITMGLAYFQGSSMYYLPLLIVQCLLLGATVDYGILLASCYIEARRDMDIKAALADALRRSIHTIMTSALILVIITGVLGAMLTVSDRAISEILLTIAKGGICAAALVIFILPGLLAAFDRVIVRRKRAK